MRLVIQRVTNAQVTAPLPDGTTHRADINRGLCILVGVEDGDTEEDAQWLAAKTVGLRIFDDNHGVMNLSVKDVDGNILAISQFTLTASTRKGNRPSYIRAMHGPEADVLYRYYCRQLEQLTGKPVGRGVFGAHMQVSLTNDGPVTIIIDSRLKE